MSREKVILTFTQSGIFLFIFSASSLWKQNIVVSYCWLQIIDVIKLVGCLHELGYADHKP